MAKIEEKQDKKHLGYEMAVHDDCMCPYCKGVRKRMIDQGRKMEKSVADSNYDFLVGLTYYLRSKWDEKVMRKWIKEAKRGALIQKREIR